MQSYRRGQAKPQVQTTDDVKLYPRTGKGDGGPRIDLALAKQQPGDAKLPVGPSEPQMHTTGGAWLYPWAW